MADRPDTLRCAIGCWLTGAVGGAIATVLCVVVFGYGLVTAFMLGAVLTVVLGTLFSVLLCRPLPTLSEVQARHAVATPARAPAPMASAAPAPAPAPAQAAPAPAAATAPATATAVDLQEDTPAAVGTEAPANAAIGTKPAGLDAPRAGIPDDLKRIKGIGPKLEHMLHGMGFYHFDQVASWGPDELAWVDENIEGFKGRATRDAWVPQAKVLAGGGA